MRRNVAPLWFLVGLGSNFQIVSSLSMTELAALLETSDQEVSRMLNKFELAKFEQDEIIQKIREHASA